MTDRYSQEWVDALVAGATAMEEPLRLLYIISDTAEGKVAFHVDFADGVVGTAGKLPRGEKADVTVTAKEPALLELWSGDRSRDVAFMAGDLKIEGAYQRWLNELVPLFATDDWAAAWRSAAA
ncbi:MAG: hypothetical protein HKN94_00870 [Acidimicrobiales bacterium]|nr:hypothetical protein [Acidimicrobiales bacterium]RZV47789.1 MAG: hypothetical protein EX269_04055 [Acidimicrobiales bacterium]